MIGKTNDNEYIAKMSRMQYNQKKNIISKEAAMNDEYINFMWNPENEYNCKKCPENKKDTNNRYPCGQQNCWVVCHTKSQQESLD